QRDLVPVGRGPVVEVDHRKYLATGILRWRKVQGTHCATPFQMVPRASRHKPRAAKLSVAIQRAVANPVAEIDHEADQHPYDEADVGVAVQPADQVEAAVAEPRPADDQEQREDD